MEEPLEPKSEYNEEQDDREPPRKSRWQAWLGRLLKGCVALIVIILLIIIILLLLRKKPSDVVRVGMPVFPRFVTLLPGEVPVSTTETYIIEEEGITGITAGRGLTGGGEIGVVTLDVGGSSGITVNEDDIAIDVETFGGTSSNSSNSGLELTSSGLRLLGGCSDGEILKWNLSNAVWECASDETGRGETKVEETTTDSGMLPVGTAGQTLRHDGTTWVANSILFNDGTNVGVGTKNPDSFKLQVAGHLGPNANDDYDLGSGDLRWRDLYLGPGSIHLGDEEDEALISYNTSSDYLGFDPDDDGTDEVVINDSGNVGIGTRDPERPLQVSGGMRLETTSVLGSPKAGDIYQDGTNIYYYNGSGWDDLTLVGGGDSLWTDDGTVTYLTSTTDDVAIGGTTSSSPFFFDESAELLTLTNTTSGISFRVNDVSSDSTPFVIDSSGKVGVGTLSPVSALDVSGAVRLGAASGASDLLNTTAAGGTPSGDLYWGSRIVVDSANVSSYATTGVTAGSGLTGGGTVGVLTLNVGAGNGITVNANDITLDVTTTGTSSTTSSNSGLEVTSSGLRLLGGCSNNQLLKWNSSTEVWSCQADSEGSGSLPSGTSGQTLRHNGSSWVADSNLYNTGSNVGVGTTLPGAGLDVAGTVRLRGASGQEGLYVNSSGNVGIGTTSVPSGRTLYVADTVTNTTDAWILQTSLTANPTSLVGPTSYYGGYTSASTASSNSLDFSGSLLGHYTLARHNGSGSLSNIYGIDALAVRGSGAGSVTNAYGVYSVILNQEASGELQNAYGVYISNAGTSQPVTNEYGIYQVSTNAVNYFGGTVGIGIASPNSELHVAGTTPQITIGDGGAEDTSIVFDGNAQDYYVALDDTTDNLTLGVGATVGSGVALVIESGGNVGIGTTNPGYTLEVQGTGYYSNTITGANGITISSGTVSLPNDQIDPAEINNGTSGQFLMTDGSSDVVWQSLSSDINVDGSGVVTIQPDAVALGTDTTGSYVATISVGNGLSTTGASSGENISHAISLDVGTTGTTATTSSNSGLETDSSGLRLLGGCSDTQILKWNASTEVWACQADSGGSGSLPSGTSGQTLRHNGSSWVANSLLFNNGTDVGIGTTSPGARLEVSGNIFAGGSSSTITYSSTPIFITMVDTDGDVARYNAIALGSDGYPRMVYTEWNSSEIRFARCLDDDCTSKKVTKITNNAYTSSNAVQVAIGSDGYPRLLYLDGGANQVFVQCTDADCTTKNTTTVGSASYNALSIASDGYARIAYYDANDTYLKFVQCTNDDCSSRNNTTVDSTVDAGYEGVDLKMGSDGYARIAYHDDTNTSLKYIACQNDSCSSRTTSTVNDPASGNAGKGASLALDSSDNAFIAYHRGTGGSSGGQLELARYVGSGGSGCTGTTAWTCTNITSPGGKYTDIELGSDGYPRITSMDGPSLYGDVHIVYHQCLDADCTSETATTIGITIDYFQNNSLALDSDDLPRISYYDYRNGDLGYSRLSSISFDTGGDDVFVAGTLGVEKSITTDGDLQVAKSAKVGESLLVGGDSSTLQTKLNTGYYIATLDTTDFVGEYTSIVAGTFDLPRISYYDYTNQDLNFLRCYDSHCTNTALTTLDSSGDVGKYTSITLDSSDLAQISYFDDTNDDLKFIQCTDDTCSTKNTTTIDSTGIVGKYTSIVMGSGPSSYPRISYYDDTNDDLKFVQCTNADCSTSNITTVASSGNSGQYTSIAMASDGFARISYYYLTGGDLRYVQCTNAACSTNNNNAVDTTNNVGKYSSIALGSDGYARISYFDDTNDDLMFARCLNDACSSSNTRTIDSQGSVGQYSSIALDASDNAHIVYMDFSNGGLKYAKCSDQDCIIRTIVTLDGTTGSVGKYPDIVLDSSSNALISYNDALYGDLKYVRTGSFISYFDLASASAYLGGELGVEGDIFTDKNLVANQSLNILSGVLTAPNFYFTSNGLDPLAMIDNSGKLGIGINPSYMVDVYDAAVSSGETIQRLDLGEAGTTGEYFLLMRSNVDTSADIEFKFETGGTAYADGSWTGSGADVAEIMPTLDIDLSSGDVLALADTPGFNVTRSTVPYDSNVIGVVSEKPGLVAGAGDINNPDEGVLVALAGRVPVKVSDENGPIKKGDFLTPSSIPGYAMKATKSGMIIGMALEDYDFSSQRGDTPGVKTKLEETKKEVEKGINEVVEKETKIVEEVEKVVEEKGTTEGLATEVAEIALKEKQTVEVNGETTRITKETAEEIKEMKEKTEQLTQEVVEEGKGRVLMFVNIAWWPGSEEKEVVVDTVEEDIDLDKDKEITISDSLFAEDNINIVGTSYLDTVFANSISSEDILKLQEGSLGNIEAFGGKIVLTTEGDIYSSGEIIADKYKVLTSNEESASLGSGLIEAGETSRTIKTNAVTKESRIFVTPKKPVAVAVSQADPGEGFTVEIVEALEEDLEFYWFIMDEYKGGEPSNN